MKTPAWLTMQVAIRLIAALAILAALWWLYASITAKPKAEAKLAKNQVEAAQASGRDAVNAVGAAGEREAGIDATTRDNERTIRNAQGANAPVDPAARDAGLASLCKRRAYSGDPKCLQFTPAR